MITQAELKQLMTYDPGTGLFTNLVTRHGRAKAGDAVGSPHITGYVSTMIAGRNYLVHRLAWLYVMGSFPPHDIDHADGDRANNRWANLRAATRAENCQNAVRRSDNNSGITGVRAVGARWRAMISVRGRHIHLGYFDTLAEAEAARLTAKAQHHEFQPVPRA